MNGELVEKRTENGKVLSGEIRFREVTSKIHLLPAPKSDNPNAPSHRIYRRDTSGLLSKIGAAWTKVAKRGDKIGQEFITLTIDDPRLPHPLNVAAFKNTVTGVWEITFRRRQAKTT